MMPYDQSNEPHEEADIPTTKELLSELGGLDLLERDLWSIDLLRRNWRFITYCLLLLIFAVVWPYVYNQSLSEITAMEDRLKDIRYRSLYTSAALIEYERINNIDRKVQQYQLQLVPATHPPYLLIDSGQYPIIKPKP